MCIEELIKIINDMEISAPNLGKDYADGFVHGFEVARNAIIAEIKKQFDAH